jgi:carbonic anhydrase
VLDPAKLATLPAVERWMHFSATAAERAAALPGGDPLHNLCEQNVLAQMEHLRTHPCVQARPELGVHGWVYQIHTGEILRYDESSGAFAVWPAE